MSASNEKPSQAPPPGTSKAPPIRRRAPRHFPPTWVWVVIVLCAALIVFLRFRSDDFDHAVVNIVTLILSFFAGLSVFIWFLFFSAYPGLMRLLVASAGILGILILLFLFPIDHLDGSLVPQKLRFRWSPKADELLAKPEASETPAGVDLVTTTPGDFPGFLSDDRTGHINMPPGRLAKDWQANPPKLLWRQPIGAGWSAFSAVNGFAVTMEQRGADELVTCYDARTGELKWWHGAKGRHENVMGGIGPRGTPTIHGGKVYALGATGLLHCLEGSSGKPAWPSKDLLKLCGSTQKQDETKVTWGRSASPLVVDDLVIVPLGGKPGGPYKSLIAFNKDTGEEVWRGGDRNVSYSSPTSAMLHEVKQVLCVNEDNVSAHDLKTGKELWSYDWPGHSSSDANSSQVLPMFPHHFFLSKAYGGGATVVQLDRQGDTWTAEPIWHNKSVLKTKFTNVARIGTSFFGLSDGVLECVDSMTGKREWKKGHYGQGQILGVGELLLVQAESGEVILLEANSEKHIELGRLAAIEGVTWNNLCLHGYLLLVRNATEAACYELPAER